MLMNSLYGLEDIVGGATRSSDFNGAISVLALVLAVVATALAFVVVLSKKKGRESQNPL